MAKDSFFNASEIKALTGHKGYSIWAYADDKGLRLCPSVEKHAKVLRVLPPLDVRVAPGTYSVEDTQRLISSCADVLDFSKAEVVMHETVPYLVLGKKEFRMASLEVAEERYAYHHDSYQGTITLTLDDVERVKRVGIACSDDDARPSLSGVFLDREGPVVATDGRRLAWHEGMAPAGLEAYINAGAGENDFIIPREVLPSMRDGAFAEISWGFEFYQPDNKDFEPGWRQWDWFRLRTGGEEYLFMAIYGWKFPNWRRVCPEWTASAFERAVFDFKGLSAYKKSGTQDTGRVCFRDGGCFQMYKDEIELSLGVGFPSLPEGTELWMNVFYLQDCVKLFGPKVMVDIALPDAFVPDNSEAPKSIVRAFEIREAGDTTGHPLLHYICMPLNRL